MQLSEKLTNYPQSRILIAAVAMVCLIGWLDHNTAWNLSFFMFYVIPIFVVAWICPRGMAFGFVLFCAVGVWLVNLQEAPDHSLHAWGSLNRLVSFTFVALAGSTLRSQRAYFMERLTASERARTLEHEIVRVSEREHRKIGQDLHDSICQSLAAIGFATKMLKGQLETEAPERAKLAEDIQGMLKKTLEEARALAHGVFPVQIEKEGLVMALEKLGASLQLYHQVSISVAHHGEVSIGDPEVATHLYRIAQEALSNALRHARASAITIELRQEGDRFTMEIGDNGRGFFRDDTATSRGIGLHTIRYRSEIIGATLEIKDRAPSGTLVRCSLPLANDPHA